MTGVAAGASGWVGPFGAWGGRVGGGLDPGRHRRHRPAELGRVFAARGCRLARPLASRLIARAGAALPAHPAATAAKAATLAAMLDPARSQSGATDQRDGISREGSAFRRRAILDLAASVCRQPGRFNDGYQSRITTGHKHPKVALAAVGNEDLTDAMAS